jgi:hypothetical protein
LKVAKTASFFVLDTFPEANYQHGTGDESTDGSQVVAAGMPCTLPDGYIAPDTTHMEHDPVFIEYTVAHTGHSMPSDPDQRQPWHTTFARVINNEVAADDPRVARRRMIQVGISDDVYLQNLLGVSRARLTHMYE